MRITANDFPAFRAAIQLMLSATLLACAPYWASAAADDAGDASQESETGLAPVEPLPPRLLANKRFLDFYDQKLYAEAVEAGLEVLRLSREEYGDDDIRLAAPIDNLATAQMMNGDYLDAENNYMISIGLIEREAGFLSERLINPLIGLGATYNRAGMYEQAVKSLERALHINHVNEGFYNFDQFKIRDGLTESYIGLQELDAANFHQETQVEIRQRKLGVDSIEVVPAMFKLASWYERSGQNEMARFTYQSARRRLKDEYGKEDPSLVEPLLGIAATYERDGLMAESASYLKKALEIVEEQPAADRDKRAEILIDLGDLYTRNRKFDTAREHYDEAWRLLSVADQDLEQRDAYFADPVRIQGVPWKSLQPPADELVNASRVESGYVLLRYSTDENGRVSDAAVIESEPAGLLDDRVLRALEHSYYRPRYAQGKPVPAENLVYRHKFRYAPVTQVAGGRDEDPQSDNSGRLEFPGSDD